MNRRLTLMLSATLAAVAACRDLQSPSVAEHSILPDSAEQMLIGASLLLTDKGVRRAEVFADTMLMYNDNTRTELRVARTVFYTLAGEQNAVLTSNQGTYLMRVGSMEARGNVIIVSTDGRRLETPQIKYDPSRDEVTSDTTFTLTEGERVTQGIGFVSNPDMTNMRILRAAKVSGSQVIIPKR